MKITINGSPRELAELTEALNGTETEAKKADFPLLLTELARSNSIMKNAKVKPIERTFSDLKPNFQAALEKFCGDKKIDELSEAIQNADKVNAPQAETAEQKKNQEVFEKQMKLLSEASEFCTGDIRFMQNLPALTCAMIDLHKYQGRLS